MRTEFQSLVISRWRPDRPAGGAALRNWQNIRALAELGQVDVISIGDETEAEKIEGVREWLPFNMRRLLFNKSRSERVKSRLWFIQPGIHPSINLYRFKRVADMIQQKCLQNKYSIGVIEELSLAPYLDVLKKAGCRVVYDAHNVESILRAELSSSSRSSKVSSQNFKSLLLNKQIEGEEKRVVLGADFIWACSERDGEALRTKFRPQASITAVPNGVNVSSYSVPGAISATHPWDGPITLLYLGSFSYFPNVEAALRLIKEVLPRVQDKGHAARVIIVGKSPPASLKDAASENPAVQVTGAVESVLPYLAIPCVVTLPITTGSGTRLKILEAFAAQRPVVSTQKGAEGIEAKDGEHLLLRETSEEIAKAVIEIWSNIPLREILCNNAFDLVRKKYSWPAAASQIYKSLDLFPHPAAHSLDSKTNPNCPKSLLTTAGPSS